MIKIRTIIVDDEAPARRRMKKLLQVRPEFELIGEAERGSEAIQLIQALAPELILLDIQLKDMTGFDVLQNITHQSAKVIFITAYDAFAIQAFEENALDYLLKPYKDDRFFAALERVRALVSLSDSTAIQELLQKLKQAPSERLRISEGKTTHLLEASTIDYVKSDTYYCHFYFEDLTTKVIRISLKQLETILPSQFLRINKSIIINKEKILSLRELKRTMEVYLPNDVCFSFEADKFPYLREELP